jgi:ketosteroid isomerase-like protein
VVGRHLRSFATGDLAGVLETLAEDASFVSGTTVVPPAEFADFFGWAMRELDPAIEITTLVADGDRVACEFVESVTVDGERRRLNRAAFYRVTGGVIIAAKVYDERD